MLFKRKAVSFYNAKRGFCLNWVLIFGISPKKARNASEWAFCTALAYLWIAANPEQKRKLRRPWFNEGQLRDLQKDRCQISHAGIAEINQLCISKSPLNLSALRNLMLFFSICLTFKGISFPNKCHDTTRDVDYFAHYGQYITSRYLKTLDFDLLMQM